MKLEVPFTELYALEERGGGNFWLGIARQKNGRRFVVRQLFTSSHLVDEWCAGPNAAVGDAPDKYHPLYVAAILTARNRADHPQYLILPAIPFGTDVDVRRSMTLNAMRMTREYSQEASLRILRLIAQRLEANQRDVVHDALVYVMRQILSAREEIRNEQKLRSESLAAYFGVPQNAVPLLSPRRDPQFIETLRASTRRQVDIEAVVEMQRRLLRRALIPLRRSERQQLALLDHIVSLLAK